MKALQYIITGFMSDLTIDSGEFARREQTQQGELALVDLPRVASSVLSGQPVRYVATGSVNQYRRSSLALEVTGCFELECQRCLQAMTYNLAISVSFALFPTEARLEEAEALDEELEGLVMEREFNLQNLIEDEILLSLPFAPLHDQCESQVNATPDSAIVPKKPNPFAVLADLKGKLQRGEH